METGEGSDVMSPVDVKALLVNQLKSLSTKVAVKNSSDGSSSVGCLGLLSVSSSIFPTSVSRCVSSPAPTYDVEEVRSTVGSSLPSVTESVGTLVGSSSTNVSALVVVNKASSSSSSRGGSRGSVSPPSPSASSVDHQEHGKINSENARAGEGWKNNEGFGDKKWIPGKILSVLLF